MDVFFGQTCIYEIIIATRELGITGALKFENCHFTAAKEDK
jgi:hypothetical protein